ncbi:TonB-dependent receptor [soil metagenome]
MKNRRQSLLASTLLTAAAVAALSPGLAFAQQTPAPDKETVDEGAVDTLVVTGTRIPKNEFTSSSPIQVLSSERAAASGVADTVQFLQSSTLASGSPQINATISSAFVTDGGPGAATISLRGLGAQRTLVLLNGRRAGPAGTRGSVSSFDLNVIPESAIDRIEILKDGASSIYGSDAIAGVVNIITKKNRDGIEAEAFYTAPEKSGGEQARGSFSWGKTFDRGYLTASFDYYKQYEQKNGYRRYTSCGEDVLFNPATGARADIIDPRTGQFKCRDTLYDQIWVYSDSFATRTGRIQFNYDNNLQNFIPARPPSLGPCLLPSGVPATDALQQNSGACYPGTPAGFFITGSNPASSAVQDEHSPFEDAKSLIPDVDRYTVSLEGGFSITPQVDLYSEVLLNRRESRTSGFRQFWTYNYTSDFFDVYYGLPTGTVGGDSITAGFTGPFILSPTIGTDFADDKQKVDYSRFVIGLKGDLHTGFLKDWNWDIFAQRSESKGTYASEVILQDAVDSQSFRSELFNPPCATAVLPVSGRTCININFTDPRILRGNFTDAERAFLFDYEAGHTNYTQTYLEGSIAGNAFNLPAGPVGAAFGFHIQHDKILDVPGDITLAGNSWGSSSAGITQGHDNTSEVFGEASIPILRDKPFFNLLGLSISGRYTDVKSSGTAETYKVGLNWQVIPSFKIRASRGTSFRAPGLFELYLANTSSFPSQRSIDPCINWLAALTAGTISQRIATNCANPAGPGGGVPNNHPAGGASAVATTGGGAGLLKPENSLASVYGVVWTPKFIDLSVAVDYFDIHIKDEVTALSPGQILFNCYNSPTFPTDPLCGLFTRNTGTNRVDTVHASYINIANQENRGIDASIRYRHVLPWQTDLTVDGQFTWQLEDTTGLFPGTDIDNNHLVGDPQFVGNVDLEFRRKTWTALIGANMIGEANNYGQLGGNTTTQFGVTYNVKAETEFTTFYHASLKKDFDTWSVLAGVSNLFDEHPPTVTTAGGGLGQYNTIGSVVLASQYTEGYYGRRFFMRVNKKF